MSTPNELKGNAHSAEAECPALPNAELENTSVCAPAWEELDAVLCYALSVGMFCWQIGCRRGWSSLAIQQNVQFTAFVAKWPREIARSDRKRFFYELRNEMLNVGNSWSGSYTRHGCENERILLRTVCFQVGGRRSLIGVVVWGV